MQCSFLIRILVLAILTFIVNSGQMQIIELAWSSWAYRRGVKGPALSMLRPLVWSRASDGPAPLRGSRGKSPRKRLDFSLLRGPRWALLALFLFFFFFFFFLQSAKDLKNINQIPHELRWVVANFWLVIIIQVSFTKVTSELRHRAGLSNLPMDRMRQARQLHAAH